MSPEFAGWQILTAVVILGGEVGYWLDQWQQRTCSQMLRAVARIKHEERLRSRGGSGSGQTPGSDSPSGSPGDRPVVEVAPLATRPADTEMDPQPSRVCRAQAPVGAHRTRAGACPPAHTSAGAGPVIPPTPASAGPHRRAVHG